MMMPFIPRTKPDFGAWRPWGRTGISDFARMNGVLPGQLAVAGNARTVLVDHVARRGWRNREIVLPAYTCSVVADAVVHTGNTPVFVDSAENSFVPSVEGVMNRVNEHTAAVIVTHMYGVEWPVDELRCRLVDAGFDRVELINDRAHCPFVLRPPKSGESDLYSFAYYKLMVSTGIGMMVYPDTSGSGETAAPVSIGTVLADIGDVLAESLYRIAFSRYIYRHAVRMSEAGKDKPGLAVRRSVSGHALFLAAGAIRRVTETVDWRKRIVRAYNEHIAGGAFAAPLPCRNHYVSHYAGYVADRDDFRRYCSERRIDIGMHFADTPVGRACEFGIDPEEFPAAAYASRSVVNLPLYAGMQQQDVDRVVEVVNGYA